MVGRYGADTTRLFSLFAAPPDRDMEWNEAGVEGCHRFLTRVWRIAARINDLMPEVGTPEPQGKMSGPVLALRRKTHQTIQKVTFNLGPRMHLNTPVSAIMELTNTAAPLADSLVEAGQDDNGLGWALRECFETIALLLTPFAPHFAEEIRERMGCEGFASDAEWPVAREDLLEEDEIVVVVQVNGKLRARLDLAKGVSQEDALTAAHKDEQVAKFLDGKEIRKVIFIPDKLLNLVVG